jgi:hypothetical protein
MNCQHRVAAHLTIFANLLGNDCPMDQFRARLWCTICGRLDCSTYMQSWMGSREATERFPEERGYYAHLERLEREGAFRWLVVECSTGKIRRDKLTAAQAKAAAWHYSSRQPASFEAMHFDQWRLIRSRFSSIAASS